MIGREEKKVERGKFFQQIIYQKQTWQTSLQEGLRIKLFSIFQTLFLTTSLILRKNNAKEKLTTGTRTVCLCHRDNSDHEVCVSSLSNEHFEKKSFSKKN